MKAHFLYYWLSREPHDEKLYRSERALFYKMNLYNYKDGVHQVRSGKGNVGVSQGWLLKDLGWKMALDCPVHLYRS